MRRARVSACPKRLTRRWFLQVAATLPVVMAGKVNLTGQPGEGRTEQKPIYLADLSLCLPQSALSRKPQRNHWRLLEYETSEFKGMMIVAGHNTAAPEVTYPLNRSGWHAIYFGLHSKYYGSYGESRLQARLQSDSTFSLLAPFRTGEHFPMFREKMVQAHPSRGIDEFFWKLADLTGENIVLSQHCTQVVPENPSSVGNPCNQVWLAYIKLEPLSEEQVEIVKSERNHKSTRRLFAHNDAWDYTAYFRPTTEAEIRRELEPYRDTDFSRIYWEAAMGDHVFYPSKISPLMASDDWIKDPNRVMDRLWVESYSIFRKKGIDPFRVALNYAHEIGLEFHAAYRTAGFKFPPPEDDWNTGGFYEQHPEWRGIDRQGRVTPRLSYAYPEVRQFVISLLKEIAEYPVDGICLLFNRRPPLVEFEPPVVEGFRAKYRKDPRQLEDKDVTWLSYRTEFLTQFMREVREAMNEVVQKRTRRGRLEVSAVVMSSEQENLYYAMDLETWIKERLVDTIIPYTSVERLDSMPVSWVDPSKAEFFIRITKGTGCKLALNLMPRWTTPEEYRRRAHALYEAGIEHFFFWDTWTQNNFGPSWDVMRRLGHRKELEDWIRSGAPPLERRGTDLRRLGDWDLSYGTPG